MNTFKEIFEAQIKLNKQELVDLSGTYKYDKLSGLRKALVRKYPKKNIDDLVKQVIDYSDSLQESKLKGKLKLKDDNIFLSYPKDIMLDINDAWGDVMDDYDINGNNVVVYYKDGVDVDTAKSINKYIRNLK